MALVNEYNNVSCLFPLHIIIIIIILARRFANEVGVSQGNRIHLQRLVRPGVFGRERLSVLSVLAALGTTMVLESVLHGGGCLRNRDVFRPSFLSRKSWLHYDLIETVARKQVFPSDCSSIFASAAALEAADNAGCPHSSGTRRDPWLVVVFRLDSITQERR